jgi:hypothetical protein
MLASTAGRWLWTMALSVGVTLSCQALLAAGKVTAVAVPAGAKPMAAKTDSKGTIHLVFDTAEGPHYVRSTDDGKTLGRPIALVDSASRKPGLEFITWDMAVAADGAVHVVLGTNAWKLKLPKEEWGYMYTRLLPGAAEFEAIRNLNHKPSEGFSLAVGDDGAVAAVWMADKLFANVSSDGGKTFGPTLAIDPTLDPCNCCTTSAAYAADGRVAVLYREESNNERDMYLGFWDPKTNKATKTRISTTPWKIDSCPMTYYSLVRSGDGFVAAWPTKGEIYFARLDADGSLQAPKEVKTAGQCGMRTGIVGLPIAGGRTLITWKKDNKLGWQLYDARGKTDGLPRYADSIGSGVAVTTTKSGDVVLFR